MLCVVFLLFFFSSRRRHTRCALVTGVQTCALPISVGLAERPPGQRFDARSDEAREPRIVGLADIMAVQILELLEVEARGRAADMREEIGRAACRERGCQYV